MSLYRRKEALKARIIDVQGLLEMVGDHPLMSVGLIERIASYSEELQALPEEEHEPKVQLLFSGGAVLGSQGIKSNFISKTLPPFQAMVKTQVALKRYGDVGARGKPKKATNSELYITALPRGSFGVELSQLESDDLFGELELSAAIKDVIKLIISTTNESEEFEENIEKTPKRILSNLKKFLREIANEKSVLKMESGELGVNLSKDQIASASQRVSFAIDDDEELIINGIFRGILLDSGKFEIQDQEGREISGFASGLLEEIELINYNSNFLNASCQIHIRVIKTKFKTGLERTEYELLEIKQL